VTKEALEEEPEDSMPTSVSRYRSLGSACLYYLSFSPLLATAVLDISFDTRFVPSFILCYTIQRNHAGMIPILQLPTMNITRIP
jgi:hypothetical protein